VEEGYGGRHTMTMAMLCMQVAVPWGPLSNRDVWLLLAPIAAMLLTCLIFRERHRSIRRFRVWFLCEGLPIWIMLTIVFLVVLLLMRL